MEKLDGKTVDVVQNNIDQIKDLFPQVLIEGKIDFDKLKDLLGEDVILEKDRYEFTWNGKREAIQFALKQSTGTLRPCKEESVNWDITQNLYIEGDNLEVLRLLQNSYRNKVKMIYIDPPYNRGKDFVYKDNFHENIKAYKERMDEQYKSNPETNGRYHTDWLNMIYSRLFVARNLLKEDGVIFISIDDKEHANLKKVADEVFGEQNFVANVIWQKKYSPQNDAIYFSDMHDFILVYAKKKIEKSSEQNGWIRNLLPRTEEQDSRYKNPDNDVRGSWKPADLTSKTKAANHSYPITSPTGKIHYPTSGRQWGPSLDTFKSLLEDNRIWFGKDGNNVPAQKVFLSEVQEGTVPNTIWLRTEVGDSQEATQELKKLFSEMDIPFDTPKPVRLIDRIISLSTNKNSEDIILDFFSGSATTGETVIKRNAADGGNRKFILVQIPEKIDNPHFKNISEVGIERIRRATKKLLEENTSKTSIEGLDIGFKVFKLDETNLKAWDEHTENIQDSLLDSIEPVKEGRTQEDVVYEVLLKYGIDLTVPIEEKEIADVKVYSVGLGYLFVCLETELSLEQVEAIAKEKPSRVVFYDDSFKTDVVRTNAQQILQRYGVVDIRIL